MNREPDRNPRKALGKGLSALLPSRGTAGTMSPTTPKAPVVLPAGLASGPDLPDNFEALQSIQVEQIHPNEDQPRKTFNKEAMRELTQSLLVHGLLQPITVCREGENKYRIVAGERRWRAAGFLGWTHIPAIVRSVEQHQRLELGLIENIQREDLNPMEIAAAFQQLAEQHGLTHEEIARRTGKDRSTITNFTRLLKLSPFVRSELNAGHISMGHGRALLNIADEESQTQACQEIVSKQLSVRETEALVKSLTTAPGERKPKEAKTDGATLDPNVRAALDEMAMALGTRVRLVAKSATSGRLEIEYYSQDDLDRIYSVIVKDGG